MLTPVMPTISVSSRSWGRLTSGSGPGFGVRRSRARPSEKYAASAPVRRPEQTTSTTSSAPCQSSESGTAEVLEPAGDGDVAAVRVDPSDVRPVADLAHDRELDAAGPGQARAQPLDGVALARHEELVILAAAGGPGERILTERLGHGARGRCDGN